MTATMSQDTNAPNNPFAMRLQQRQQSESAAPPQTSAMKQQQQQQQPEGNPFARRLAEKGTQPKKRAEPEEGGLMNAARTLLQLPLGWLEGTAPGLGMGFLQLMAMGESDLSVEDYHNIRKALESEGREFPEEGYEQARQQMLSMIPTVRNLGSLAEEYTGVPLTPKTHLQEGLRFASMAGSALKTPTPNKAVEGFIKELPAEYAAQTTSQLPTGFTLRGLQTKLPRPVLGAGVEAANEALQAIGVPEQFAQPLAFGVVTPTAKGAAEISIGGKEKPGGMTARGFEKLKDERAVPEARIQKINKKIEGEFRELSNDIIKDAPIGETAEQMANNPRFRQEREARMEEVQVLADSLPDMIDNVKIGQKLLDKASERVGGLAVTERETAYANNVIDIAKKFARGRITAGNLVKKYRAFNDDLKGYYEPTSSKNRNWAKQDAILEANRAIAEVIDEVNPTLGKTFREENAEWSKMMDAQFVDDLIGDIFPESVGGAPKRINFKEVRNVFDKKGYKSKLTRALGEEGYKQFEGLLEDLLKSERPYKMLKVAEKMGYKDMAKVAIKYAAPFIAGKPVGIAVGVGMGTYQGWKMLMNAMLDKPQVAINFKKAFDNVKVGNFKKAEAEFAKLDEIITPSKLPKGEAGPTIDVTSPEPKSPKGGGSMPEKPANTLTHALDEVRAAKKEGIKREAEQSAPEGKATAPKDAEAPAKAEAKPIGQPKLIEYKPSAKAKAGQVQRQVFGEAMEGKELSAGKKHILKNTQVTLMNTRGQEQQFHGTKKPIEKLNQDINETSGLQNIFGAGFYTTDALDIAHGYANPLDLGVPIWLRASKEGESKPTVYKVKETTPQKLYDLEQPIDKMRNRWINKEKEYFTEGKEKLKINPKWFPEEYGGTFEEYLDIQKRRGYVDRAILKDSNKTMRDVYLDILHSSQQQGRQAFNMQHDFDTLQSFIEKDGYEGLIHTGGLLTKSKDHKVKIYWKPENLEIEEFAYPKNFEKVAKAAKPPELPATPTAVRKATKEKSKIIYSDTKGIDELKAKSKAAATPKPGTRAYGKMQQEAYAKRKAEAKPAESPLSPKTAKGKDLEKKLDKAFTKLQALDEKILKENRANKINIEKRGKDIKKHAALQKIVDDLREELARVES